MDEKTQAQVVNPGEVFEGIKEKVGKFFLASKTIWVNALVLVVALVGFVAGPDFPLSLSAEALQWLLFIQAMANLVLRFITNEPLRLKK